MDAIPKGRMEHVLHKMIVIGITAAKQQPRHRQPGSDIRDAEEWLDSIDSTELEVLARSARWVLFGEDFAPCRS